MCTGTKCEAMTFAYSRSVSTIACNWENHSMNRNQSKMAPKCTTPIREKYTKKAPKCPTKVRRRRPQGEPGGVQGRRRSGGGVLWNSWVFSSMMWLGKLVRSLQLFSSFAETFQTNPEQATAPGLFFSSMKNAMLFWDPALG